MALPRLREELVLLPGPRLGDGQPSWTLHDPVCNRFFSLDWSTFEILHRWSFGDASAIVSTISADTTLQVEESDVEGVIRFLADNQLVHPPAGSAHRFAQRWSRSHGGYLRWLLHHYLFFRIPLVRPDAWLGRWQPVAGLFYSRTFAWLTVLALVAGLTQVLRQWDVFATSMVDTFNWDGVAAYGVSIFLVKLIHELGHAFTAKRLGCRIPSMGVAFIVLWPMAYTDTNDIWRLSSSKERLQVASAGIVAETVIAAWATLGWALLPDGAMRSAAFVLATTSWAATLVINASPFMRFDGYFILSDLLEMPNMHDRSFALARWQLREWLFALGEDKPEYFPIWRERALIAFAWATWLYRLIVFLGIAVLVYHFFIKAIGILLFAVEIVWFTLLPICHELLAWKQRWPVIRQRGRSRITLLILLLGVILMAFPWPVRVTSSGTFRAADIWPIFSPGTGQLQQFGWKEGDRVEAGTQLMVLDSPDLQTRHATAAARVERLRWQAAAAGFNVETKGQLQSRQDEFATAATELAGIERELARYAPRAPFAGYVHDIDPDLRTGQWVARQEKIAVLVTPDTRIVETYLDEESVKRIAAGDRGIFIIDSASGPVLPVTVTNIDADTTRILDDRMLAAPTGGNILVRERKGAFIPEHATYRVSLSVDDQNTSLDNQSWRGKVIIRARWEAPAWFYIRNGLAVLLRESGF